MQHRRMRPDFPHTPAGMDVVRRMRLIDWLSDVDDVALGNRLTALYRHYLDLWAVVPGSSQNHQAWPGGLRDHLAELCRTGWRYYCSDLAYHGAMPFTFDDVVVAVFCHDAEKLVKHGREDDPRCGPYINLHHQEGAPWETVKFHLLDFWEQEFGLVLSNAQRNAVKYTHGEPDGEYRKDRRVMGELAAFVGNLDRDSARVHHDKGRGLG